jgi:hypothetical protein
LTGKEWVFLGICSVVSAAVPEIGVPLAEQYIVSGIIEKLGVNVIVDYAVDLGYDAASAQHNPQAAATYVAQMVKEYQNQYNDGKPNVQVSVNGGPVESLNNYVDSNNGLDPNLHGSNITEYIDRYKALPSEAGLNKTTLSNDAYLGTQAINDPTQTGQAATPGPSIAPKPPKPPTPSVKPQSPGPVPRRSHDDDHHHKDEDCH